MFVGTYGRTLAFSDPATGQCAYVAAGVPCPVHRHGCAGRPVLQSCLNYPSACYPQPVAACPPRVHPHPLLPRPWTWGAAPLAGMGALGCGGDKDCACAKGGCAKGAPAPAQGCPPGMVAAIQMTMPDGRTAQLCITREMMAEIMRVMPR